MNESHRAAQNDAKKHAHIDDLETENKGLPAAVKLRVAAPLNKPPGQSKPAIVGRQVHKPGHCGDKRGFRFASFCQPARQTEAKEEAKIVHDCPEHTGSIFPQQEKRAVFCHP